MTSFERSELVEVYPLGPTPRDRVGNLVAAAVGTFPGVGPALQYLLTQSLPNDRLQRIETLLRHLARKLGELPSFEEVAANNEAAREVFQEGLVQSARATSEERIAQIAELIRHGFSPGEAAALEAKRLLNLLRELDDDEIIVLMGHAFRYQQDESFQLTHEAILAPEPITGDSPREVSTSAIREMAKEHLVRLNLLSEGQIGKSRTISPLGRVFLRCIGVLGDDEF